MGYPETSAIQQNLHTIQDYTIPASKGTILTSRVDDREELTTRPLTDYSSAEREKPIQAGVNL